LHFKVWFLIFGFLFFALSAASANSLPAAEDINNLTESAKLTADTFMQESFKLRMGYEYAGQFLNQNDKNNLQKMAKRARNRLAAIEQEQRKLKQQIEDYEGDDWDAKYGSTRLWRKLSADLYTTTLSRCQIDFYLALSSQQPQRNKICKDILAQIDSLNKTYNAAYSQFLKAKTLTLLARTDPAYKPLVKKEFDWLSGCSDMQQSTAFRIAIERIKLLGETRPGRLNALAEELAQSSCADDIELVLCLAFLQRQYDPARFEKTIQFFPQTENFVGSLVLADLSNSVKQQQSLQQASVFEAELAILAAWGDENDNHKMLLDSLLSIDKFQTPLILYVAAAAFAESSPTKAANLLVQASKLQQLEKSDKLDIEACEIAKQAAQLAYNLFAEDSLHCQLALEAFENYCEIAGEKIDEELEYLYTVVLNDCGQAARSKELLQKIADSPAGNWRNRARLDLIIKAMRQTLNENPKQQNILLERLGNFILNCHGQDKTGNSLRNEAITIYCRSLLELKNEDSAQNVLTILAEAEATSGINLDLFRAQALQQLGRLDESVHYMLLAVRDDSGSLAGVVVELLAEVVDTIDRLQLQADDFDKMMQNCKKLADFSYVSLNDTRAGLILAEISIFEANKNQGKLLYVEKLLNSLAKDGNADDVDLLRCRARLLAEQGKFDEAAGLWSQICKIRKNDVPKTARRSWKWWRAKFYELHCCAKCTPTKKESILHTIEVLENSFQDIPPLWAKKLSLLKQQCR